MAGNQGKPTRFEFIRLMSDDIGDVAGGLVEEYTAGGTLLIGDAVYLSAAFTVNKSLTPATVLGKMIGIVVGGARQNQWANERKLDVGLQASLVNERVQVLVRGKIWVVSDSAITAGDVLTNGTVTAGRVKTGTITTDVAAGDTGRIIGNALEAAAGAGLTILASISLK
jgi:hypothetical protein